MILRGVNLPPLSRSGVAPARYSAYLDVAKSMGFNVIRLPVSWAELEPSSGRFSTAYLGAVTEIVDLAGENGMYVVVDMHQFKMDGFPAWVVPRLKTSDRAAAAFWHNSALRQELVKACRMSLRRTWICRRDSEKNRQGRSSRVGSPSGGENSTTDRWRQTTF